MSSPSSRFKTDLLRCLLFADMVFKGLIVTLVNPYSYNVQPRYHT